MNRRKIKVPGSFKERFEKVLKAFSVHDNKAIRIDVEASVGNEELALEIKRNIKVLNLLSKEAKKRGLTITTQVGLLGVPTDLSNLDIRIYEYKEY